MYSQGYQYKSLLSKMIIRHLKAHCIKVYKDKIRFNQTKYKNRIKRYNKICKSLIKIKKLIKLIKNKCNKSKFSNK